MAGEGGDLGGAEVGRPFGDGVPEGAAGGLAAFLRGIGIGGVVKELVSLDRVREEKAEGGDGPHAEGGVVVCPVRAGIVAEGLGVEAEAEGDEEVVGPQGEVFEAGAGSGRECNPALRGVDEGAELAAVSAGGLGGLTGGDARLGFVPGEIAGGDRRAGVGGGGRFHPGDAGSERRDQGGNAIPPSA